MNTRIFLSFFFLTAFFFTACRSPQRLTESGNYDDAIDFCVRKLRGKKKKTEYVQGLETAFRKAQTRDMALCDQLIAEDRPENWERIHTIHRFVRERQNKVIPLLPLTSKDGYRARIELADIATMEKESREKAAGYLYDKAESLLIRAEKGDKQAAREAFGSLEDLERRYFRDYKNKTALKEKARDLGTSYILFSVKNQSVQILPVGFEDRILQIGKFDLDHDWKSYYFEEQPNTDYDYKVVFRVRNIDVAPERLQERAYTDKKEIQDGWNYVLDSRGNVLKDTCGNDIKTPRFVWIHADVLEVHQTKAVRLAGTLEIRNGYNNQLLDTHDVSTEILFENYASTFRGDERALTQDSRCRIGNRPLPFPRTEEMLVQAADRLKPQLRDELRRSRAIF